MRAFAFILLSIVATLCFANENENTVRIVQNSAPFPPEGTMLNNAQDTSQHGATDRRLQAANVNGPWPECIGKSGDECKNLIKSNDPSLGENVKIAYPRKFNYYRIWVHVDENGIVTQVPGRG